MVAELPPAVSFMLSEFPGNKLALPNVRKRLGDASFVRDYFDQCCAGIGTFKYADRLKHGSTSWASSAIFLIPTLVLVDTFVQ